MQGIIDAYKEKINNLREVNALLKKEIQDSVKDLGSKAAEFPQAITTQIAPNLFDAKPFPFILFPNYSSPDYESVDGEQRTIYRLLDISHYENPALDAKEIDIEYIWGLYESSGIALEKYREKLKEAVKNKLEARGVCVEKI